MTVEIKKNMYIFIGKEILSLDNLKKYVYVY